MFKTNDAHTHAHTVEIIEKEKKNTMFIISYHENASKMKTMKFTSCFIVIMKKFAYFFLSLLIQMRCQNSK